MATTPRPGQPGLLRELNDEATLSLLLDHGPLSRNDIASMTGLSKPTAAEIVRRLEASGVLMRVSGEVSSGRRGPNAVQYQADIRSTFAAAIDIQLQEVSSAIVDATGRHYPTVTYRMSPKETADEAAAALEGAILRAASAADIDSDAVSAALVSVQASVDHASDSLLFTDIPGGWPHPPVATSLSRTLGLRVSLENNANLAAVAERREGAGAASNSFALCWLAEGIGFALDLDGRVRSGASGAAGETGYLSAPRSSAHLEPHADTIDELTSEDAVVRLAVSLGVLDSASAGEPDAWTQVVRQLPKLPDGHSFVEALAERVGHNVLPVLAVTDPDIVILHGPIGIAGGTRLAAAVTKWLRTHTRWSTPVHAPAITTAPSLRGAAFKLAAQSREALLHRATHTPPTSTTQTVSSA